MGAWERQSEGLHQCDPGAETVGRGLETKGEGVELWGCRVGGHACWRHVSRGWTEGDRQGLMPTNHLTAAHTQRHIMCCRSWTGWGSRLQQDERQRTSSKVGQLWPGRQPAFNHAGWLVKQSMLANW